MSDTSYTIFEYNNETMKYKELGEVNASTSAKAREFWARETGWKPKSNTQLFAKPPVCR
jgi:hypothetical protein